MADNIELNAGTGGAVVATDEVTGSVHYQIVKLAEGGDGVAVPVSGSTPLSVKGTTEFPLPIVLLSGTVTAIAGTVTVVGNVTTTASGTAPISGSVSIIGGTVGANITGGRLTGTSPIDGSVSIIGGTLGAVLAGSINTRNMGGSVQISSIVGTLPDKNQNQTFRVLAGSTSIALGSVGGTGDYLSHVVIVVGSTDANQVILADHTSGTFTIFGSAPGAGKGTYTVPVLAYSRIGPWRLSVGGGANVIASGRFTN